MTGVMFFFFCEWKTCEQSLSTSSQERRQKIFRRRPCRFSHFFDASLLSFDKRSSSPSTVTPIDMRSPFSSAASAACFLLLVPTQLAWAVVLKGRATGAGPLANCKVREQRTKTAQLARRLRRNCLQVSNSCCPFPPLFFIILTFLWLSRAECIAMISFQFELRLWKSPRRKKKLAFATWHVKHFPRLPRISF